MNKETKELLDSVLGLSAMAKRIVNDFQAREHQETKRPYAFTPTDPGPINPARFVTQETKLTEGFEGQTEFTFGNNNPDPNTTEGGAE